MAESNRILYENRNEPPNLTENDNGGYLDLRITKDPKIVRAALDYLLSRGQDYVFMAWQVPPWDRLVGYDVLPRSEAAIISERSKNEGWTDPQYGWIYDGNSLERRLDKLLNPKESNWSIYQRRDEPPGLKRDPPRPFPNEYHNLGDTADIDLVRRVMTYLEKYFPGDYVIGQWSSPPFGVNKGYGVYSREEHKNLTLRQKEEGWGFPRLGFAFDKDFLERKLSILIETYSPRN